MIVAFWAVYAFLAHAITGLALGRVAIGDASLGMRIAALALGVLLVGVLLSIPYFGSIVGFVVMLLGLGSICLSQFGNRHVQSFVPMPAMKPVPATMV